MEVFWVLVVIALLSWAVFVQVGARKHVLLEVPMSEQAAAEVVAGCFNISWTQVTGEGDLNFRPKLRMGAPVVSIDFAPDGMSKCGIEIWTSRFSTRYGMMSHAQLAWRKKRKLASELTRNLDAATS